MSRIYYVFDMITKCGKVYNKCYTKTEEIQITGGRNNVNLMPISSTGIYDENGIRISNVNKFDILKVWQVRCDIYSKDLYIDVTEEYRCHCEYFCTAHFERNDID